MKGSSMIMTIFILVAVALVAVLAMPAEKKLDNTVLNYKEQGQQQEQEKERTLQETVINNESQEIENMETQQFTKATFETSAGTITLELFTDKAPKTVANFGKLASEGFYDGVRFHRIIEGFMIQAGDPQSKDEGLKDVWGTGGPGYAFDDELPQAGEYEIGSLAMANSGPNTNGSQFFIVSGESGVSLPPLYSLFGKVTNGMDIVEAISTVTVDGRDRPVEDVMITSITVE